MRFWLTFLTLPVGILTWSWVSMVTWAWFAPVISPLLPPLGYAQCVAIRALLAPWRSIPTPGRDRTDEEKDKDAVRSAVWATLLPLAILGVSFVIHLFVHLPAEVKP